MEDLIHSGNKYSDLRSFYIDFKKESEKYWEAVDIDYRITGFQVQRGTRWLNGLSDNEIQEFEKEIGFNFPVVYKEFLKVMNGTDKDAINVYSNMGEPFTYGVEYYSFPRDINLVRDMIGWIYDSFHITKKQIEENQIPHILPIMSHRFLVIDRCETNPVLSMYGNDVILYANSLPAFLYNDIFNWHRSEPNMDYDINIKFWLD
ncbi:MAG: SMI1/KNR4 family protein [Clostridia bacterium]|nr:SMI1/KNR4 family protein [Clostridia bacterium]